MTARSLIEFFSTHTNLPVKIEHVRDQIIDMGVEDKISFVDVEFDIGVLRGQFVRTTNRPGVYADPIYAADIYYGRDQELFWQRLVCCKEMMHLFDKKEAFVCKADALANLTEKLAISPDLQVCADDAISVTMDKFAVFQALCVMFPKDARDSLVTKYKSGEMSSHDIAMMAEIPERYIRLAMNDNWDTIYEVILKLSS